MMEKGRNMWHPTCFLPSPSFYYIHCSDAWNAFQTHTFRSRRPHRPNEMHETCLTWHLMAPQVSIQTSPNGCHFLKWVVITLIKEMHTSARKTLWWSQKLKSYEVSALQKCTIGSFGKALVTLKRVGGIICHLKQVSYIPLEFFPSFFLLDNGWHETHFECHLTSPTPFNVTEA